jgi:hypothetical protein
MLPSAAHSFPIRSVDYAPETLSLHKQRTEEQHPLDRITWLGGQSLSQVAQPLHGLIHTSPRAPGGSTRMVIFDVAGEGAVRTFLQPGA